MRRMQTRHIIWIIVAIAAVVAVLLGWTGKRVTPMDRELLGLENTEDAATARAGAMRFVRAHPDLDRVRLGKALSVLMDADYETGGVDAIVASLDSLIAEQPAARVTHKTKQELHDALVMRTVLAPKEGDVERADQLARELLDTTDLMPGDYMMMASMRSANLDDVPSWASHWLTVELAWRAFRTTDAPSREVDSYVLDNAFESYLDFVSRTSGLNQALASSDSLAAVLSDETVHALLEANRYRLLVETDPEMALEAARRFDGSREASMLWNTPNGIAVDIRDRGLDYDLALDLSGWALTLAHTRSDSQTVFSTLGWIHHLKGDDESARQELEASMALLSEPPSLDDGVVKRLLAVYAEQGAYEPAIELLAGGIARSIETDAEAKQDLADLLVKAGRSDESVSDLIATYRYAGVSEAPDLTVRDISGESLALADLRGRVVLLNLWTYG